MDSPGQAARDGSQDHRQAHSMPSRSRTLSASDSGVYSKATEPRIDVDLASDNSCEDSPGSVSQIDTSTNTLNLLVSTDAKVSPETNPKTTVILESCLDELKSQATSFKAQTEVLKQELAATKEEARTWQFRHASTTKSLESRASSLKIAEVKYEDALMKLQLAAEELEDRDEKLRQCQLEIRQFRLKLDDLNGIESKKAAIVEEEKAINQYIQRQSEARQQEIVRLEQNLQDMTKKLEDSNNDRDKWKQLASSFQVTHEHFVGEIKQWVYDKAKMKTKLSDAKKDLKSAQQNHDKERTKLQALNDEAEAEHIAQQEHWNESMAKLLQKLQDSQGLSQRYNFNISDSELLEHWENLKHRIGQFVNKYTYPVTSGAQSTLDEAWQILAPNAADFLIASFLYTFAFEAYIWQWLIRKVFGLASQTWAGSMGVEFQKLLQVARASLRGAEESLIAEYHSWRANSSNLLSRLSERSINFEHASRESGGLVDRLSVLLAPQGFDEESAKKDVLAIFMEARSFDIMRRKLRADIIVKFGLSPQRGTAGMSGFKLDSAIMKNITPPMAPQPGNQTLFVELCVSPALIRMGNSDGSGYDRRAVLDKMRVLCNIGKPGAAEGGLAQAAARQTAPPTMPYSQRAPEGETRLPHGYPAEEVVGQVPVRKNDFMVQDNKPAENGAVSNQEEPEIKVEQEQQEPRKTDGFETTISSSQVARTPTTSTSAEKHENRSAPHHHFIRTGVKREHPDADYSSEGSLDELTVLDMSEKKNYATGSKPSKKKKNKVKYEDEEYQPESRG